MSEAPATNAALVSGRRIVIGYALVAMLLAAAVAVSLAVGSQKQPPPMFGGTYVSAAPCLSAKGKPFSIVQSGEYVDFSGGPSGSFRLQDRKLSGSVRCRNGSTAQIRLREGTKAHPEPLGTVRGQPARLHATKVVPAATGTRSDEDTIGRLLLAMAAIVILARVLGSVAARLEPAPRDG